MTKLLQRVQGENFDETQCSDHLHITNKYIYDALSRIHCCSVKICRHAVKISRQHRSMRSSSARHKDYRLVILIVASSVATIYSTCVCVYADDALNDELWAWKVAAIVLAVVTGLCLIVIIILIRYYIIRQRTASQ